MEEPVIALHRIQRFKEKVSTCPSANCEDKGENPHKKLKLCSCIWATGPTNCNHNLEVCFYYCSLRSLRAYIYFLFTLLS